MSVTIQPSRAPSQRPPGRGLSLGGLSGMVQGGRLQIELGAQSDERYQTYGPPTNGLFSNTGRLQSPQGTALVLENFLPTPLGVEPREGYAVHFEMDDPPRYFMFHSATSEYFVAGAETIHKFNIDTRDFADTEEVVDGLTGYDYSHIEFRNDAATFLLLVNGEDFMRIYDGEEWHRVPAPIGIQVTNALVKFGDKTGVAGVLHLDDGDGNTQDIELADTFYVASSNGDRGWNFTSNRPTINKEFMASGVAGYLSSVGTAANSFLVNLTNTANGGNAQADFAKQMEDHGTVIMTAPKLDIRIEAHFSATTTTEDPYIWPPGGIENVAHKITAVDTSDFAYIWPYNNRIFAIEKGTTNAWYSGINAVSGAYTKLPLAGVFSKGGNLLFGATWSSDSGEGLDDRCVFVTDQGQVVVYSGDPNTATSWQLQGLYDIGIPIHKNFHVQIGGDLIIGTRRGMVPLTAIIQKDPTQLDLTAITFPINDQWQEQVQNDLPLPPGETHHRWKIEKWDSRGLVFVSLPESQQRPNQLFVLNMENSAWTKFVGWNLTAMGILEDRLYVGTAEGFVGPGLTAGFDAYVPGSNDERHNRIYLCKFALPFDTMGAPGMEKHSSQIQYVWTHLRPLFLRRSISINYATGFPPEDEGSISKIISEGEAAENYSPWDSSGWDLSPWSDEHGVTHTVYDDWEPETAKGHALSVQGELVSGSPSKLVANLVAINLKYRMLPRE